MPTPKKISFQKPTTSKNTNTTSLQNYRHFGDFLRAKREQSGLSIETLAQRMNGSYMKWLGRIQGWEEGKITPKGRYKRALCQMLNITSKEWKTTYTHLLCAPQEEMITHKSIPQKNRYWIAKHYQLLFSNRHLIQENPEWKNIFLSEFHVGTMYFGGAATMRLGTILELWDSGAFVSKKEDLFYILHGGGSPLSGWQQFYGFQPGSTKIEKRGQIFSNLFSHIGPVVRTIQEKYAGLSKWSLPQLLTHLGVDIPSASIYQDNQLWGSYDFKAQILHTPFGSYGFDFCPTENYIPDRIEEEEFDKPRGKTITIHNIATMQLGAWRGEKWIVHNQSQQPWTIRNDGIENPQNQKELFWDGDIPPVVAEQIVKLYTQKTRDYVSV